MVKAKMVDLKIKVPARWIPFIEELCSIAKLNADKELFGWLRSGLVADIEEYTNYVDRISLIERHGVQDIYEIPQWMRDKAAGISRTVKIEDSANVEPALEKLTDRIAELLTENTKWMEIYRRHQKAAIVEGIQFLSPNEKAEICALAEKIPETAPVSA